MYFQAWAQWIKEARNNDADFVLLDKLMDLELDQPHVFPSMRIFFLEGPKVC